MQFTRCDTRSECISGGPPENTVLISEILVVADSSSPKRAEVSIELQETHCRKLSS